MAPILFYEINFFALKKSISEGKIQGKRPLPEEFPKLVLLRFKNFKIVFIVTCPRNSYQIWATEQSKVFINRLIMEGEIQKEKYQFQWGELQTPNFGVVNTSK